MAHSLVDLYFPYRWVAKKPVNARAWWANRGSPAGPPGRARGERHALRVAPVHPQIPDGLRGVLIGSLQDGEAVALEVARPEEERPPRVGAMQQSSVATRLNRERYRIGLFGKYLNLLPCHLLELRSEAVLLTATVLQPG